MAKLLAANENGAVYNIHSRSNCFEWFRKIIIISDECPARRVLLFSAVWQSGDVEYRIIIRRVPHFPPRENYLHGFKNFGWS